MLGKRKVTLAQLLLNADVPAQPWLEPYASALVLIPERDGVRLVADKKALTALSVGDGTISNSVNRMVDGTTVRIRDHADAHVALDLTLQTTLPAAPPAPNPYA